MIYEDEFEPHLGRIRSQAGRRGRAYLQRVLRATALAGAARAGRRAFNGSRIGRGAVAGRLLASRDRFSGFRRRRVIVKYSIAKLANKGADAARAHLRYIQRDGVTREGQPGRLYSADEDRADGRAFLDRADGDRHQIGRAHV